MVRRGKAPRRSNIVAVRVYAYAFFLLTSGQDGGERAQKRVSHVNNLYGVSYETAK